MKLDAKDAAKIAKKYFEETKGHLYFLFETIKIAYDHREGCWIVDCEVTNIFEEASREYLVRIRDEDGTIADVEIKQPT
ncbi:MAG: hypothetical protein J7J06_00030 [Methanosarcinales archaeon]|nr:hypothetical protein [Methanosarcinales archaeon]